MCGLYQLGSIVLCRKVEHSECIETIGRGFGTCVLCREVYFILCSHFEGSVVRAFTVLCTNLNSYCSWKYTCLCSLT